MKGIHWQAFLNGIPFILILFTLNVLLALILRLSRSYVIASEERDFSRRIISIVGHDLQSPLSITRQATEVLISDRNWDAVELIQKSNLSAIALLKDLSLWGKSRYGELRINETTCQVSDVVDRVLGVIQSSADFKGVRLETDVEVPTVQADPDVLSTILRNLMSNAVKFSRPDAVVKLEVRKGDATNALFRISDEGEGMEESQVRDFRNRKSLVSHPGTRGEKGSGIGLNLVNTLCDQAGWTISLDSIPDDGTVFTVSVPIT